MDEKRISAEVEDALQRPFWREYYEEAPSDACKRFIALGFYSSACGEKVDNYEEYKAERAALQEKFTREDWTHLYKYSGHNPWRSYCKKKMDSFP